MCAEPALVSSLFLPLAGWTFPTRIQLLPNSNPAEKEDVCVQTGEVEHTWKQLIGMGWEQNPSFNVCQGLTP